SIPYAIERYVKETSRLYAVLDKHLEGRDFIAGTGRGEYTIADMACYPWIVPHDKQGQNLDDYPNLQHWFEAIQARPGTQRAYAQAAQFAPDIPAMTDESRRILFGQDASTVRREG
ncbi:MAG TPA: glutathione binding-like protein, partial [Azospira sp.]|nr:glutathione binding-like protein [Azospira sp.]